MSTHFDIGLVADGIPGLLPDEVDRVCAALQKQITEHVGPVWNVDATIRRVPSPGTSAGGHMTIVVLPDILAPGLAGFHAEQGGSGYSAVRYGGDWSITASHECLEMLCNPHRNEFMPGPSPMGQGEVEFLKEVCDPCQNHAHAYPISDEGGDILVSDFCLPAYYDANSTETRFSHTGRLTAPLQVSEGSYLCWRFDGRLFKHSRLEGEPEFGEFRGTSAYADLREHIYAATPRAFDVRAHADCKVIAALREARAKVSSAVAERERQWKERFETSRARAS
jgi:uncharacterized protein YbaR (Trm112 family)